VTENQDNSEQLIGRLIGDIVPGAMVTKFVVVAEIIETDGSRALVISTQDGAKPWDTLGMLQHAVARENGSVARDEGEDLG
jgi:hypothetical protein